MAEQSTETNDTPSHCIESEPLCSDVTARDDGTQGDTTDGAHSEYTDQGLLEKGSETPMGDSNTKFFIAKF